MWDGLATILLRFISWIIDDNGPMKDTYEDSNQKAGRSISDRLRASFDKRMSERRKNDIRPK